MVAGVVDDQIAAAGVDGHVHILLAQAVFDRRHNRRARARAAGQRFAVAALEAAHLDRRGVDHADELGVDALGEDRRVFKQRADFLQIELLDMLGEHNAVRIAGRDAGDGVFAAADLHAMVDHALAGQRAGHVLRPERHRAHIDRGRADLAKARVQRHGLYAAGRLDGHAHPVDQPVVVDELGHAADAVAGHESFGAVAVEYTHLRIGDVAALDQHKAVRAHAVMPVAQRHAQRLRAGDRGIVVVDVDVVAAGALHFGEAQFLAAGAQVIDVHQLGVGLVVAAGDDVGQRVGGVQRGKARHAQQHRLAMQRDVIVDRVVAQRAGIDHIVDLAALEQRIDRVALAERRHSLDRRAQHGHGARRIGRGVQAAAQIAQLARQRDDLVVVIRIHGEQHAGFLAGLGHLDARAGEALEQRLADVLGQTQHLAG